MKKRVLIIDDDRTLNQINQKVLMTSGFVSELHISSNGKEALDYLLSRREKDYPLPDIIIFDLRMPVMDGFAFLEAFNAHKFRQRHNIELVVFTGSGNPRDQSRAMALGARHYINKPYLLRGLTDIVYSARREAAVVNADKKYSGSKNTIL